MKITIESLSKFDSQQFHDCAISTIECNYDTHVVVLPLLYSPYTEVAEKKIIIFNDITHVSIEVEEPWGEGIYICDMQLVLTDNKDLLSVAIQLNSGDKIKIHCKSFQI